MARPHVEFIQSQNLTWQDGSAIGRPGALVKLLSVDPTSTSFTALVRLPGGWQSDVSLPQGTSAEEFYVLDGAFERDGTAYGDHHFGYVLAKNAAHRERNTFATETTYILWRHDRSEAFTAPGEPIHISAMAMPWDSTIWNPKLDHLKLSRKTLRVGPDQTRTWLLAGLPHGLPPSGNAPMELHPHAEEMLLIAGDMWSPQGRMTRGAYFYRPPEIWHGKHWSELGFLMIMRSPGANKPITEWGDAPDPIDRYAPFKPELPANSPESWRKSYIGFADF